MSGFFKACAMALPTLKPTNSAPTSPALWVTANASTSQSTTPPRLSVLPTTGRITSTCFLAQHLFHIRPLPARYPLIDRGRWYP
ncbi:hypothetical protein [Desulforhabdus amnigena]|uniref:hypothetical protein n=1 Tax=Desulforhabdus amnigena TaxID=40218 RepID=UPI002492B6C9|nr:hypothetical protein [Desulforhabdus amnigena]